MHLGFVVVGNLAGRAGLVHIRSYSVGPLLFYKRGFTEASGIHPGYALNNNKIYYGKYGSDSLQR